MDGTTDASRGDANARERARSRGTIDRVHPPDRV